MPWCKMLAIPAQHNSIEMVEDTNVLKRAIMKTKEWWLLYNEGIRNCRFYIFNPGCICTGMLWEYVIGCLEKPLSDKPTGKKWNLKGIWLIIICKMNFILSFLICRSFKRLHSLLDSQEKHNL